MITKPRQIGDGKLLELIESGDIEIRDVQSAHPTLVFRGRVISPELVEQRGRYRIGSGNKRYTWRIRYGGQRRRIVRSRLVWMFVHRQLIPDGEQIDHGEFGHQHDGIGNLTKMVYEDHYEKHYGSF